MAERKSLMQIVVENAKDDAAARVILEGINSEHDFIRQRLANQRDSITRLMDTIDDKEEVIRNLERRVGRFVGNCPRDCGSKDPHDPHEFRPLYHVETADCPGFPAHKEEGA